MLGGLFHFLFGEPAGCGEVGGAGGSDLAEFIALLLIHEFGEGPLRLEGAGGAAVLLARTDEVAGVVEVELGDGFGDGRGHVTGFLALGTLNVGVGDLTAVDGFAGDGTGDLAVEEAAEDFGEHELDGGVVLKEGNGDAVSRGKGDLVAIEVLDAEICALDGALAAGDAPDGEGAAGADGVGVGLLGVEFLFRCGFCGFWFCCFGCFCGCGRSCGGFSGGFRHVGSSFCAAIGGSDSGSKRKSSAGRRSFFCFYPISLGYQVRSKKLPTFFGWVGW